jgi:HlyD family secretion protein
MRDVPEARRSEAPPAGGRRRGGLLWAALALVALACVVAVQRTGGPATIRYRLEQIDRGEIRSEVTARGTVSEAALAMAHDLSRVQVRATVSESDLGRVAVGEAATLRWWACSDCVLSGTVSEVGPSPRSSAGGGRTVLVDADNHDHKLIPGMGVMISIEVVRRENVLRLPLGALGFAPPGMESAIPTESQVGRVFLLDHGRLRSVRVTVGLRDLRHAELVAGPPRDGDAVVVGQN